MKGETCDIFHFPGLLSQDDCAQLVALGLCYQQPAPKAQPATAAPLPARTQILNAIEVRIRAAMAACTKIAGVCTVFDEEDMEEDVPAALVWEEAESETLRNSNWTSAGAEVNARFTAWLSPAFGGKVSFPAAEDPWPHTIACPQ